MKIEFHQLWSTMAYDSELEQDFWSIFDQTVWLYDQGLVPVHKKTMRVNQEDIAITLCFEVSDAMATMFLIKFPQDHSVQEIEIEKQNDNIFISDITRIAYE